MRWPLIRYLPSHTHIDFVKLAPFAAVLSALAIAGSVFSFFTHGLNLGIDFAGLGITPLGPPANAAPAIIGAWLVLGVALLVYFRLRAPERVRETAALFVE